MPDIVETDCCGFVNARVSSSLKDYFTPWQGDPYNGFDITRESFEKLKAVIEELESLHDSLNSEVWGDNI